MAKRGTQRISRKDVGTVKASDLAGGKSDEKKGADPKGGHTPQTSLATRREKAMLEAIAAGQAKGEKPDQIRKRARDAAASIKS
jgi:hypothetical protein